jgi:hypothetical protein
MVHTKHYFSVKEVGLIDVVPGDKMDEEKFYVLRCMNCHWGGWVDEYHEAVNNIIRLFKKGEDPNHGKYDPNIPPDIPPAGHA